MTDKTKTIAEALAEVQRIANLQKGVRVAEMNSEITGEPLDEAGLLGSAFGAAKNIVKNVSLGAKGAAPAGQRVAGRFGAASTADRAANKVGKNVVKPVIDNPKLSAFGAGAGAAGTAAGIHSMSKSGSTTAASAPASSSTGSSASAPAAPSKGAKYAGGAPHKVTTYNPSKPGEQATVKSQKTEKGWADAGAIENKARATGSFQQQRHGKVLPPSTQLGTPKSMDPVQGGVKATPTKSATASAPNAQQRWDASRKAAGVNANTTKALTTAAQSRPSETSTQNFLKSQGIGKKVAEETEVNPHIASFLELMGNKSGNIFEAAKKLSAKQKKIAAVAGDPDKIDADDFKELRGKKMEEESKDFLGGSTVTKDPKKYVDPSTPKVPYSQLPKPGNKAGEVISKAKGAAGMKEEVEEIEEGEKWIQGAIKKPGALHKQMGVPAGEKIPAGKLAAAAERGGKLGKRARLAQTLKSLHKEETEELFSESELAYFEAVAKKSPHLRLGKGNEDERGMGDTVSDTDTTN